MFHLIAQTTQPSGWNDPKVVFGALGGMLILLLTWWNTFHTAKVQGQSDAQDKSIDRLSSRLNTQDAKINETAIATGVPTMPAPPPPPPPPRVQT